jgi:hypothetical protein
VHEFELTGKSKEAYNALESTGVWRGIVAKTPAVRASRLLQAASGFMYVPHADYDAAEKIGVEMVVSKKATFMEEGSWCLKLGSERLNALLEICGEAGGENVLVAAYFRASIDAIIAAGGVELNSESAFNAWNAGTIKLAVVHPRSAGHGLNLQFGGRRLVMYEWDHSNDCTAQVIERIGPRRQLQAGFNRAVYVHYLRAAGGCEPELQDRRDAYENYCKSARREP